MSNGRLDLPLIECPVAGTPRFDTFVVFFSGDGGWARFDRSIAAALVAAGVPVVGWSAFRYLWRRRTSEDIARDLARVITHYRTRWQCQQVLLVGFSRGADLLPFGYNRLDAPQQQHVTGLALLGVTAEAGFGYRLVDWLGIGRWFGPPPGLRRIAPEIGRLPLQRVRVINGQDDPMAVSSDELARQGVVPEIWPGDHHMNYAHGALADRILSMIGSGAGDTQDRD